jgi:hypothetical protein
MDGGRIRNVELVYTIVNIALMTTSLAVSYSASLYQATRGRTFKLGNNNESLIPILTEGV